MHSWPRSALVSVVLVALVRTAAAQQPPPAPPTDPYAPVPTAPTAPPPSPYMGSEASPPAPAAPPGADAPDMPPGRGDFDAGGQVRLPSGPDEMGAFATFNWIALDLKGRYFLLDSVTVNGNIPLAIIKPDSVGGIEPKMIGGMAVTLDAKLPRMPFQPEYSTTELGVTLGGAYMREGAMLLSEKDFPLFVGDFQPGLTAGLIVNLKLSTLLSLATRPVFVYQSGSEESITAVQIPVSTVLALGSLLKVSADLGIFTGDDYSFGGDDGGRIAAGGSLTLKLGPILFHAGAGVASLLSGGAYPTISDSVYIDVNLKYAK
jgi:hypothetical protein